MKIKFIVKLLCLGIIPVLIASCSNSGGTSPDLEQMKLKGSVKTLEAKTYRALEQNGEVVKDEDTPYGSAEYMYFDKDGQYTSIEYYRAPNELESKQLFEHNRDKYAVKVIGSNGDGISDGEYLITYDNQNRISQRTLTAADGTVKSIQKYVYTTRKDPDSIAIYNQNSELEYTYAMTYDVNQELETLKVFSAEDAILASFKYTYNANNYMATEVSYNAAGEVENTESSEYEYDSKNNWVKKITRTDNKIKYLVERTITYY